MGLSLGVGGMLGRLGDGESWLNEKSGILSFELFMKV